VGDPVDLDDLRRFYRHPVKHFLNRRLNVVVPRKRSGTDDGLPVALNGRDRSAIGSAIYRAVLANGGAEALAAGDLSGLPDEVEGLLDSFRARGAFPPSSILDAELVDLAAEVAELLAYAGQLDVRTSSDEHHPIETALSSGVRLVGMVTDCVGGDHPGPIQIALSRGTARSRLGLALDLLALTVNDPSVDWRSVYLARPEGTSKKFVVEARRVRGDTPTERHAVADGALDTLIAQYRDGQRLALPLFSATSRAVFTGPPSSISTAWETSAFSPVDGEDIDPYHVRAFGELSFIELDGLDIDGFTLRGEAERLWGTLDDALVDGANDREVAE
jgi:exodeoxyribonuclease V gamma subunit